MRRFGFVTAFAALVALAAADKARADDPCLAPGYLASFAPGLPPEACTELAEYAVNFGGRSVPLRVIRRAADASGDDAAWMVRAEQLARRMGPALDAIGGLDLMPVTILLSSFAEPDPDTDGRYELAHAATRIGGTTRRADAECPIVFYKQSEPTSLDEFIFTYAHEVFHCVQAATVWNRFRQPSAAWWVEGTAEYFAIAASPGSRQVDDRFAAFETDSHSGSILDLEYENVVFFLWLAADRGPGGVRSLMEAMPETDGGAAQLSALQGAVPIGPWTEFAKAWMDGQIPVPGGRRVLRPDPRREYYTVSGPAEHVFETSAYRLTRTLIQFEQGFSYDLDMNAASGDPVTLFSPEEGGWGAPPTTVNACDEPKVFRTVTTSTEGPASHQIVITDAHELDRRACCLIGDWKPTAEALAATAALQNEIGGAQIAATGGSQTCSYDGGDWTLSFNGDGSGAVAWNDFANLCITRPPPGKPGSMSTRGAMNGAVAFAWEVLDRGVGRARYGENAITQTITITIGPQTIVRSNPDSGPRIAENGFAFQCSEAALNVKGIYPVMSGQADHVRQGAAPP